MKSSKMNFIWWQVFLLTGIVLLHFASSQSCTPSVGQLSCTQLNSTSTDVLIDGLAQAALLQADFQLIISQSDVLTYPASILSGYDLTYISVDESPKVVTVPKTFLSEVTSEVTTLSLTYDTLQSLTAEKMDLPFKDSVTLLEFSFSYIQEIEPNTFLGYDNVKEIHVDRNQLFHLAPDTFTGLTSLTSLQIWKSQVTTVDVGGFGKLPALETLAIQTSPLNFLQEGVFDGLPDVFQINLGGIYFNCTCELQWLKDWLNRTEQLSQGFCMYPRPGDFADINFCDDSPPTSY